MPQACWLPFSHWNLRYNPFGQLTVAERARVAIFDPQPFVQALQTRYRAIQFIGPCGRGKTTRLLAISQMISQMIGQGATPVYLPPYAAAMPRWWVRLWQLRDDPLIIDEGQRIPWPIRVRLFRRGTPLVVGTHRDLSRTLRWAGYQVISVPVGPDNDPQHVCEVVNARVRAARLTAGEVPQLSLAEAELLVARFGDDLRAIESFLYHQVQQQAGGDGQMRFID